mmetsp:Transcript_16364/g.33604  ORF Transcript_16364/g.33604 Transcript_16364/m.33604 type:complete len:241 (-) Transcript_16364:79-801(-)
MVQAGRPLDLCRQGLRQDPDHQDPGDQDRLGLPQGPRRRGLPRRSHEQRVPRLPQDQALHRGRPGIQLPVEFPRHGHDPRQALLADQEEANHHRGQRRLPHHGRVHRPSLLHRLYESPRQPDLRYLLREVRAVPGDPRQDGRPHDRARNQGGPQVPRQGAHLGSHRRNHCQGMLLDLSRQGLPHPKGQGPQEAKVRRHRIDGVAQRRRGRRCGRCRNRRRGAQGGGTRGSRWTSVEKHAH